MQSEFYMANVMRLHEYAARMLRNQVRNPTKVKSFFRCGSKSETSGCGKPKIGKLEHPDGTTFACYDKILDENSGRRVVPNGRVRCQNAKI